jgi:hypothetical protein
VAAAVHFAIPDERGAEILDELEQKTEVRPYLASPTERRYNLDADHVTTSGFDAMLDRIADDWRDHLDRTPDSALGERPLPRLGQHPCSGLALRTPIRMLSGEGIALEPR